MKIDDKKEKIDLTVKTRGGGKKDGAEIDDEEALLQEAARDDDGGRGREGAVGVECLLPASKLPGLCSIGPHNKLRLRRLVFCGCAQEGRTSTNPTATGQAGGSGE